MNSKHHNERDTQTQKYLPNVCSKDECEVDAWSSSMFSNSSATLRLFILQVSA